MRASSSFGDRVFRSIDINNSDYRRGMAPAAPALSR
jgi:hypothetical protein